MPSSYYHDIPKILDILIMINPDSILDVGCGYGKYGVLSREYLDLGNSIKEYHKKSKRIDCLEIYKKYLTPLHKYVYSNIIIGNVIKKNIMGYDIVLLIDVLEHFNNEDAKKLLGRLLKQNKFILISTPKYIHTQKESFGNKYETHLSQWNAKNLRKIAFENEKEVFIYRDSLSLIACVGDEKTIKDLGKRIAIKRLKSLIREIPGIANIYYKR